MIITLCPTYADWGLPEVIYSKDALTINGELFDFGPLPDGATLPHGAVVSEWFSGEVSRIGGEIHLTLKLPYSILPASDSVTLPAPIRVTKAGAVKLPFDDPPQTPAPYQPPQETEDD